MKINSVKNQNTLSPNFKGFYKIKADSDNYKFLKEVVKPYYKRVQNQDMDIFVGAHPFQTQFELILEENFSKSKYTKEWMKSNAEQYGADFSNIDNTTIFVVTQKQDTRTLRNYIKERIDLHKKELSLFNVAKNMIHSIIKPEYDISIPQYHWDTLETLKKNKIELYEFNKFMADKKVTTVDSVLELCSRIMQK